MIGRPTTETLARQVEAWRGPLAPDVDFIDVRGGRVHVVAFDPDAVGGFPVTADGITDLLVGAVWTRCRKQVRKHIGGLEQSAWLTDEFADERLCRGCVASVPETDQWRLFEHRRPGDPKGD